METMFAPLYGEIWISMVEFSDPIKAFGLMTYGNSRQPDSRHRDDRIEMFAEGKFRKLWLASEEVEANAL